MGSIFYQNYALGTFDFLSYLTKTTSYASGSKKLLAMYQKCSHKVLY